LRFATAFFAVDFFAVDFLDFIARCRRATWA
jgi:hypothetical protein